MLGEQRRLRTVRSGGWKSNWLGYRQLGQEEEEEKRNVQPVEDEGVTRQITVVLG